MGFMVSMPGTNAIRRALNESFTSIGQDGIRDIALRILKAPGDDDPTAKPKLLELADQLQAMQNLGVRHPEYLDKFQKWMTSLYQDWLRDKSIAPAYGQIKLFLLDRLETGTRKGDIQFFWDPAPKGLSRRPMANTGPYGIDRYQVTAITEPYWSIVARLWPRLAKRRAARKKAVKPVRKGIKKQKARKKKL